MLALDAAARAQQMPAGALYVVATPIGNVADSSLRALHILDIADAVAAEDTRNSQQLLARLGLDRRRDWIACHQHNEREAAARVIERLAAGARVAYVSDAGTPGISDPGARLVAAVRAAGHRVIPMPGPSAVATALSAAGFDGTAFHFAGFLPTSREARLKAIRTLAPLDASLVFYEAPHRIADSLAALEEALGATRRIVIARELTKLHEQIFAGTLAEARDWLGADANHARGEFVLVIEAAPPGATDDADLDRLLKPLLAALPLSRATKVACEISGLHRKAVYARALALRGTADDDQADAADGD
ncbi:16S rRNA (cytidine(1402)-2'-O)-methyltransferase [Derxia lacustris]|uniref:16S rRNA (cytidine(1402)-2'-O)-methyltransferase n=1 Tax=Derxia lacustris TaxID=764842 RepID=UPI000A16F275